MKLQDNHFNIWKDFRLQKFRTIFQVPPLKIGNNIITNNLDEANILAANIATVFNLKYQ